jgi:hypothetical protein
MLRAILLAVLAFACGHRAPASVDKTRVAAEAEAAYEHKDWGTCAAKFELAENWYNAACCRALAGDRDAAFALLGHLTNADPELMSHMKVDTDLAALHYDPRWIKIIDAFAARVAAYEATINRELRDLYDQDQADRQAPADKIDWSQVAPRDQAREKRVDEILAAGGAKVSDDYYHAAMVFQHADGVAGTQHAHDLAMKAVTLDPKNKKALWLAAASEDRILVREGKPQKWATQFTKKDGAWILNPVDPSVTDEQRAEWNVPPLAEAQARAVQMNAK